MGAIDTLTLSHFKAFDSSVTFPFKGKNALLFGENGSGKTSVFEAMKMAFFHERLKREEIRSSDTPEEETEKLRQLYEGYRNAKTTTPFSILINGVSYETLTREDYKVFLVTHDDFELDQDCILLSDKLSKMYFDYGNLSSEDFIKTICDDLVTAVNKTLEEQFSETVTVKIEKGDRFRCVLSDAGGKLEYGTHLSRYYNEGKIHLILIIIYINAFLLLADKTKHNILVLDDFVTSLDATNRAFVLRFLFDAVKKQDSLQLFILTHNVSFYNLTKYYINNHLAKSESDNWNYFNLYNLGESHKLYPQDDDSIDKVLKDLREEAASVESIGNRIRQLFEIQVHELAKIIISGGIEESKDVLARLDAGKPIYYNGEKNVYDLVQALENMAKVSSFNCEELSEKILSTIDAYKNDPELQNLREILKHMTLFQKISLHPTSHGTLGLAPVSQKEIKESIQLVKNINQCVCNLKGKDVINI